MSKHGNKLPREIVASSSLETFKAQLVGQSTTGCGWPRPSQWWDWTRSGSPFQPPLFWVSMSLFKLSSTKNYYLQQTNFKRKSHSVCLYGGTHRKICKHRQAISNHEAAGLISIPRFLRWNCSSSLTSTQSRGFAARKKAAGEQPCTTSGTGSLPEGPALCRYPEPNPAWVWHFHPGPGLGALCAATAWGVRAALHTRVLQPREGCWGSRLCLPGALLGKGKLRAGFFLFLSLKRPGDSEAGWGGG